MDKRHDYFIPVTIESSILFLRHLDRHHTLTKWKELIVITKVILQGVHHTEKAQMYWKSNDYERAVWNLGKLQDFRWKGIDIYEEIAFEVCVISTWFIKKGNTRKTKIWSQLPKALSPKLYCEEMQLEAEN